MTMTETQVMQILNANVSEWGESLSQIPENEHYSKLNNALVHLQVDGKVTNLQQDGNDIILLEVTRADGSKCTYQGGVYHQATSPDIA